MTLGKLLVGGVSLSIAPLLLNVISLPALAYLIRQLGPTAYGQWTTATVLVASFAMLASLGLRGAFIRDLASGKVDLTQALADQLGTRLLLSALAAVLGTVVACAIGYPPIVLACVAICAAAMIIGALASTLVDALQAMHQSVSIAAISFIAGLTLTLTSVGVVFAGGGPIGVALAYCVGPLTLLVLAWLKARRLCDIRIHSSIRTTKSVLTRSGGFAKQQLLNAAPLHAESLLLPTLLGFTHFGFFNAGALLSTRLTIIPDGVCTAAYPMISRKFAADRKQGVRLAWQVGLIMTVGCILIALVAAIFSGPFSRILFPSQPQLCQFVLLVTIWALPLSAIDSTLGYALNAAGADGAQARASLPAAICNVLLFVLLLTQLGIVGACIALPLRSLVRIVMLSVCCLQLRRASRSNDFSPVLLISRTANA